jgi:hypothetical protein
VSDIGFDFSEMNKLAADFGNAAVKIVPFARKAVEVTAQNIKTDGRKGARRTGTRAYAASFDYTMKLNTDGEIGAEIGPNLDRSGGSFGILEDAAGDVKSRPQHALRDATKKNEPDFVKGLEQASEDALK